MITTKVNRTERTLDFYRGATFVRSASLDDPREIAIVRAELEAAATKAAAIAA